MLTGAALGLLNHLLSREDWARERLKPFAGQTARITSGALSLRLAVTADGLFAAHPGDEPENVCMTLPADAPLLALTDRSSLIAAVQISGSADLAECLGFVFRNLRWDTEDELARLVGDIAARRLVMGGQQVFQWHRQQARNLALNVAEYFTEEHPSITSHRDISTFSSAVDGLNEPLVRLEKRIAALEGKPR